MKSGPPTRAMVLAAGRGERMRPLTDRCPKPLLEIAGKSLIVHCIERLVAAGITDLVINHAWLGGQIVAAIGDGSRLGARVRYSPEPEGALEVGGGIVEALPLIGEAPFVAVNADVWCDYPLQRLPHAPTGLAHLVMVDNPSFHPDGDFVLREGRLVLDTQNRLTYSGIGLFQPEMFSGLPRGRRTLLPLLEQAIRQKQASGEHHRGDWHDVGTPQRLAALSEALARLR